MNIWRYYIDFHFRVYDFWIGFYYSRMDKTIYICPLPMCCIRIAYRGGVT